MSNLMKMKRLVDGDDHFAWRVEAACWQQSVEYTREVVQHVAANEAVLEDTELDEFGTIDSSGVSDEAILSAVEDLTVKETE